MSSFTKLPINLKPREKFEMLGGTQLTDQELIAIILQRGTKEHSVMQISQKLFERYGSLQAILEQSVDELMTNEGVGRVKAIELSSLKTIFERYNYNVYQETMITKPQDVYELTKDIVPLAQEHLVVICVDVMGNVICKKNIFVGTISEITIHPREIFNIAIKVMAYGIFVVHNHPSGDFRPSENDINSTQKLIEAGKFLNVKVLDHIIVSKKGFYSLRENCDIII